MTHEARAERTRRGAEEVVDEDGGILHVPALIHWLVICDAHQYYCPLTVAEYQLEEIDPDIIPEYLRVHRKGIQMNFDEAGCGAIVPPLTLP